LTGVYYAIVWVFPCSLFESRAQLAPGSLGQIFMEIMISAGKEVNIGLGGGRDKPLRPPDMLLHSWNKGLDVCVDLTVSSPLTQTRMIDFARGQAVIVAAQRKRVKYEAKYAYIGYDFLPFSFSSFAKLEKDAMTLLKRVRRFFVTQNIRASTTVHISNRISFTITRSVEAQIVSRLPTGFLNNNNNKIYFSVSKSCSTCSRFILGVIYRDHVVSCAGSSPLTQIGMTDFVPGRVVIDVSQRKRVKYEAKFANIKYSFFLSHSLLLGIREGCDSPTKADSNFFVAQDIGARVFVYIFSRVTFAIAKGIQTQESKVDTGKAVDADIRPIYDEEPMAELQLAAECNIFAIGQKHTK
nr:hypothetical protein [Tanacetum cinerariifolium]